MNNDTGAVMYPYFKMFPEWGEKECKIVKANEGSGLPVGAYAFIDLYCTGKDCDCRRVMINVIDTSTLKHLATINYGFDEKDKNSGPFLDVLNKQSKYSAAFLELFRVLLTQKAYVERLKEHYRQVKEAMADPGHAIHRRIPE